ncbi:MAG: hypothetical protein WC254_05180 [Candidatus Woesearchaeota archaeon]|jgi:hypothetical protein
MDLTITIYKAEIIENQVPVTIYISAYLIDPTEHAIPLADAIQKNSGFSVVYRRRMTIFDKTSLGPITQVVYPVITQANNTGSLDSASLDVLLQ